MPSDPVSKPQNILQNSLSGSMRMYAIIAYFSIIVLIGVPLWWKTTEVYRVDLPHSKIENLASKQVKIQLKFVILSDNYLEFEQELRKHLLIFNRYTIIYENYNASLQVVNEINSAISEKNAASIVEDVNVNELILVEYPKLKTDVWFSNSRKILIRDANAKTVSSLFSAIEKWSILQKESADEDGVKVFTGSALHILMTVVVPRPEEISVEWNSEQVLEQYVRSFAGALSKIYDFTFKSQWLYLMELDFNAKQVADGTNWGRHYAVSESRLTHVVTPLETKLAAQVALPPKYENLTLLPTTLNLVLYVPPCQISPIVFYNKKGKMVESEIPAFVSIKWGGVIIANPSHETCLNYLDNVDIDKETLPVFKPKPIKIMGIFLAQLRQLLGLREPKDIIEVSVAPLNTVYPRHWELDVLKRKIVLQQIDHAKLTLKSLSKLLGEISNIVINDDIGESVYTAVENIEKSSKYLENGQLDLALECSKKAFVAAETAFMDPSLLSLLYFPDDQKYAVYIPLFLPVMIPVLMSLRTMFVYFFKTPEKQKED